MKNILAIVTATLFITLLFTQCNKDDSKIFNTKFYTTQSQEKLFLYIDGTAKGELPYFAEAPDCNSVYSDGPHPFIAQLPSGEYRVTGKNSQGDVVTDGMIKLSKKTMGVSGFIGGQGLSSTDDCVIIYLNK